MKATIERRSPVPTGFRSAKVQGLFDLPRRTEEILTWDVDLPIEGMDWSVGAIVGASGTGKSTLAAELWPKAYVRGHRWRADCLLDDFPEALSPQDITQALSAVGFSSPPAWLRPYRVLSTGQQFRSDLARALLAQDLVVYDEFTSVVDRTVAKAASVAVGKYVRREGKRFVAVTCHRDVLPWLEPDWWYDTDSATFRRERLQRPPLSLAIREGSRAAWPIFRPHHYLARDLSPAARVFLAYLELDGVERLAGMYSLIPAMGMRGWWRSHRTVVLPDFQGLGIGNGLEDRMPEVLWRQEGKRVRDPTAAVALVHHRRRRPHMWRLVRGPSMMTPSHNRRQHVVTSAGRLTTTWEYVPEALRRERCDLC